MTSLLEIEGLEISRRAAVPEALVDGISLTVRAGETLGIIGESGSGKTLLSLACIGLLPPALALTAGTIRIHGTDIAGLAPRALRALRGRQVGMVFQDPLTALNPIMTIGDQLIEAVRATSTLSRHQAVERTLALLDQVHFPDARARLGNYPHQLSGGLRQRVAIAIAIAGNPRLLIADEPTTALDATVQQGVLDMIAALQQELGFAMLLISHDIGVVAERADRLAVFYAGRIMETGPTAALLGAPAHPYTRGLLAAQPGTHRTTGRRERLAEMAGHVPHGADRPAGCPFQPRCAWVEERCGTAYLRPVGTDRASACIRQAVPA